MPLRLTTGTADDRQARCLECLDNLPTDCIDSRCIFEGLASSFDCFLDLLTQLTPYLVRMPIAFHLIAFTASDRQVAHSVGPTFRLR